MVAAVLALPVAPARAQRMSPPPNSPNNPNPRTYTDHTGSEGSPFKTKTIAGELVEVKTDSNSISLKGKDGKILAFDLDPKTKLKADKNTELADKKTIELGDFQAGQSVEVTVDLTSHRVSEVRLKRQKKS
jgi:hypothetical protein